MLPSMSESTVSSEDLPMFFSAFDTVLSLHYSTSITVPKVHDLCEKATQLTRRRIDTSTLERILTFDPQAYQIVHFGLNSFDYGVCTPEGVTPIRFSALLPDRRRAFEKLISSLDNTRMTCVKLSEIAIPYMESWQSLVLDKPASSPLRKQTNVSTNKVSCRPSESPTKVSKGSSVTTKSFSQSPSKIASMSKGEPIKSKLGISNSSPRFKLKENTQSGGLSLLERIKLKEKKKKAESEGESSRDNYSLYIKSKIPAVYDVLYELNLQNTGEQRSFKSIPMSKMVSIVKDSFPYAMTDKEIIDTLHEISSLLSEKVKVIRVGEINAIKIFVLDRNSDLPILNEKK